MTFFELDQRLDVPRAIHTFVGSIWIDADSEQDAATWGSFGLNVTCQTPPVIDERKVITGRWLTLNRSENAITSHSPRSPSHWGTGNPSPFGNVLASRKGLP